MSSQSSSNRPTHALARPTEPLAARKIAVRVLTRALAEAFAVELLSDVSHTVNSAARAIGIKPSTVHKALARAQDDACRTLEDEEICDILAAAKESHIKKLREYGFVSAGKENRAGVTWLQWQLEVQDPRHHPRKQEFAVEMAGKDGGPIQTVGVRYVVNVPAPEPEDDE
jgi:hypothetical protein